METSELTESLSEIKSGNKVVAGPPHGSARSAARLGAVQALYQLEATGTSDPESIGEVIEEFLVHRLGQEIDGDQYTAADREYFVRLVRGTSSQLPEIDEALSGALTSSWSLQRLDRILRCLLRAATCELMSMQDVPYRVVINEYLDVAHAFLSGDEPALVNGVLDRLARKFRDMPDRPDPQPDNSD